MQPGDHMWLICEQFHRCVCSWPLSFHCGKCLTAWSVILLPVACARSYQNFPRWIVRQIYLLHIDPAGLVRIVLWLTQEAINLQLVGGCFQQCWYLAVQRIGYRLVQLLGATTVYAFNNSGLKFDLKKSAAKLQVPVFNCSEKTYKYNFACFSYCSLIHLCDNAITSRALQSQVRSDFEMWWQQVQEASTMLKLPGCSMVPFVAGLSFNDCKSVWWRLVNCPIAVLTSMVENPGTCSSPIPVTYIFMFWLRNAY